jgi:hypothetical protein
MFEHLAGIDRALEIGLAHEVVILPVDLALARGAGGGGDREGDRVVPVAQAPRQGGFARARGRGQDDQKPASFSHVHPALSLF